MATQPDKYAREILDKLVDLDKATTAAFYDMGQLLSAIRHGKLYELLGYESMKHLIEEELSYTASTAYRYLYAYRHFRRLKYTKTEALALLGEFGFTHMLDVLPSMTAKAGERAIRNRIDALDENQINFTITNNELQECNEALAKMGGYQSAATGRWANSSEAVMEMVRQVNEAKSYPTQKLHAVK